MSLRTVSASCLNPLGQISSEFVDLKQSNLCKYSSPVYSLPFSFPILTWELIPLLLILNTISAWLPLTFLLKKGTNQKSNISAFLIHLPPFFSYYYRPYYWMTMTQFSLFVLYSAHSSLVPTCLCSSFIPILITLPSFHFLTVPPLGLRLLKNLWF